MKRVSVVGSTGSGKTTFGATLARRLDAQFVEMDALFWGPDWSQASDDVLTERVEDAVAGDSWVIDGNYSRVQPVVWARADTIVWLDFSFPRTFWRLVARTFGRLLRGEELWHGNRESLRKVFSKDSIVVWQLKTFRRVRKRYRKRYADPRWTHAAKVRLRSPRQVAAWLERHAPIG